MLGQWVSPLIGKIIRFGTNKIDYRYCYRRIYIPRGDHSLQAPTVFILFIAESIFQIVFTFCKSQRFLFRLRPDVFSMRNLWVPTVFILFIAVSVFRVAHRATALHSDKAVESSLS